VVAGRVVVLGPPVIAHLVGGALAPDARAVAQVLEVAVLRIISQPCRNSRIAPAIVAIGAVKTPPSGWGGEIADRHVDRPGLLVAGEIGQMGRIRPEDPRNNRTRFRRVQS
jgi:hypothetical protein